jgi:hypothetical protein
VFDVKKGYQKLLQASMTRQLHLAPQNEAVQEEREDYQLKDLFETDGYICLRQSIPPSSVNEWKEYGETILKRVFQRLHENGHTTFPTPYRTNNAGDGVGPRKEYAMQLGVKHGFREIVMRSPGRYEVSLAQCQKILDDDLPPLEAFLKESRSLSFIPSLLDAASWEDVRICHVSLVVSFPDSPEQSWHADGGHVSIQEHLPCHCLNIFIPLTDITLEMGPTELRPGTHYHTRNLAPMMLAAKARKTLRAPVTPLLAVGDVLMFDYRVLHRGRANQSHSDRTILVLTVAKPWFKDVLNFPTRSLQERV